MGVPLTIVEQCAGLVHRLPKTDWDRPEWVESQARELVRLLATGWQGSLVIDVEESGVTEREGTPVLRLALVARGAAFLGVYLEIDLRRTITRPPVGLHVMVSWFSGRDTRDTSNLRHVVMELRGTGTMDMNRKMCAGALGAMLAWEHNSFGSIWGPERSAASGEWAVSGDGWGVPGG